MSIFAFIKNGRKQRVNMMPSAYPSSRVTYGNSNAEAKLDSLTTDVSGKVSKSGDTMTGALNINHSGSDTPLALKGNSTDATYINFKNSEGTNLGYLYIDGNNAGLYKGGKKPFALQSQLGDYVAKSGDTMTGTLNTATENNVCLNLRPSNADWIDTVSVQTGGNEAVVFANKNVNTSWMFVNGEDSVTNHGSTRWQSLVPALQLKNGCASIGKLIGNGADPIAPLAVNGKIFQYGFDDCSGNGNYGYFKIATVTVSATYINYPIVFEVSQRFKPLVRVQLCIKSASSDHDLQYFHVDNVNPETGDTDYYVYKVNGTTFEVYGQYDGVWGNAQLHRVYGIGANRSNTSVSINMTSVASLPSGSVQAKVNLPKYSVISGSYSRFEGTWREIGIVGNDHLFMRTS